MEMAENLEAIWGIDPFVPGSLQRALSPGTSVGSTILHLSAHGTPQGLVLEDGKGSAHLLNFELLQEMLALRESGQSPCELVVVNACHSSAVGQFLAESGIPHVVCCNDRVLDSWAEPFIKTFYTTLFGGSTVAAAFSTASLQLQCQPGIPREARGNHLDTLDHAAVAPLPIFAPFWCNLQLLELTSKIDKYAPHSACLVPDRDMTRA